MTWRPLAAFSSARHVSVRPLLSHPRTSAAETAGLPDTAVTEVRLARGARSRAAVQSAEEQLDGMLPDCPRWVLSSRPPVAVTEEAIPFTQDLRVPYSSIVSLCGCRLFLAGSHVCSRFLLSD